VLCIIDMIVCTIFRISPFVTNFSRPIVILIFMASSRQHLWSVIKLIQDSAILLMSIFIYVAFFSFIGFFLFKNTMEGYSYFKTPGTAFYQMFICLTTSNFPNVMLPAYYDNSLYAIYFIGYLIGGLYFLMNVLLATIFDNYKLRVQEKFEKRTESREVYLSAYFDKFDTDNKGFLNLDETKKFMATLLDLDYKVAKHRATFRNIMKIVDVGNFRRVDKSDLLHWLC